MKRILLAVVIFASCLTVHAQARIQVLLLSGRSNHDWRQNTPQLKRLLEQSGRFEVRVNEEPSACTADSLAPYAVLINDYHGPRWNPVCEKAVADFVRGGRGFVSVHGAIYGFGNLEILGPGHQPTGQFQPPWPEYAKMLGASWPQPPQGSYHAPRHIYEVRLTNTAHPITAGLPARFRQNDELYHSLTTSPDITLLATAYDDPKNGGSGKDEPIAWTVNYGKGRVFTTVLGHDLEAMTSAGFIQTFLRGTEWAAAGAVTAEQAEKPKPVRVLVVTGGHGYESSFYTLFDGYPALRWQHAFHGATAEAYTANLAKDYDVLVLYDMVHESTAGQRDNLMQFVHAGKGIVMLHHAIASFASWPQYAQLVGGRYYEKQEGEHPPSSYAHDQDLTVHIVDKNHPVTRGLPDFELNDEAYKGMWVSPDVHLLMTTDHPKADRPLAWISPAKDARVVTILLGHGPGAYYSPTYRRLVYQAIQWAAGRN